MWKIGKEYNTLVFDEGMRPVAFFADPADARKAVTAVNHMPRNPYLPEKPADGEHVYWDQPQDIGGNHRCKLCGAYKGSIESKIPCEGEFKESGKMRVWAQEEWDNDFRESVDERPKREWTKG